jgi:hypothetical protein
MDIGNVASGDSPLIGGITDLTINTDMTDSDWYKQTSQYDA